MQRAASLAARPEMNDKPSFLVAVAGLDPQQVRLIEIVFRHIQYNRYVFRLAELHQHAFADIVIAGIGEPDGRELLARTRDARRGVPAIAVIGAGEDGGTRHAIEIGRLTRQLLPILNRVVEIEGLAGEARPGPGAGFAVAPEPSMPPSGGGGQVPPLERGASPSMRRVLVIDDSATVRAHLRAEFERMGLAVDAVASGDEALDRLAAGPVDLAMLDLGLPDTDGLHLARRIRSEPRWRELPIVVLTSHVSALDVVRGAAAGCSAYLAKPVDTATLRRVVERQLGRIVTAPTVEPALVPTIPG
jgi:CheY-like chemotaxis protein